MATRNLVRSRRGKALWVAAIIVVLLTSSLSLMLVDALAAPNTNKLSTPVEIAADIPGTMGYCVYQLTDGSLVVNSANQTCTFLTKLDPTNHLLWTQTFQISQKTNLPRLLALRDGGFLLAGVVDNQYVMVRTDSQGNTQWTKSYSAGAPITYLMSIIETADGGFALAGFGVPVFDGLGWVWFTKTDSAGSMQWSENISGPNSDCPSKIIQTLDGGYIFSDTGYSFVPDQALFKLIKLNAEGHVLGNTTYGGYGYYYQPECNLAITTGDGGYLLAGYLWQKPAWVVKVDSEGAMQWNQTYAENGCSITGALETQNGYLLLEYLNPNNIGIILTDNLGKQIWNATYSGVTLQLGLEANFNTIIEVRDGGYIMVASKDQFVWLVKLSYPKTDVAGASLFSVAALALAATLSVVFVVWQRKEKPKKGELI